jgi:hypothetical protein
MKKKVLLKFLVLIIISICIYFNGKLQGQEAKTIILSKINAITIDGVADERAWQKAEANAVANYLNAQPVDAGDFSAQFKVAWNDTALYFLAEVTDDAVYPNDHWAADQVEWYIKVGDAISESNNISGDHAIGIHQVPCRLLDSPYPSKGYLHNNNTGYNAVTVLNDEGYVIEGYITWSSLNDAEGNDLTGAPESFKIDVNIQDNDADPDGGNYPNFGEVTRGYWSSDTHLWEGVSFAMAGVATLSDDVLDPASTSADISVHSITVDGDMSDWGAVEAHTFETDFVAPDLEATYKLARDAENIYALVEVKDDTAAVLNSAGYEDQAFYLVDLTELFFDTDNAKNTKYDDNDFQLRIFRDNYYEVGASGSPNVIGIFPDLENVPGVTSDTWGTTYQQGLTGMGLTIKLVETDNGYLQEIGIPIEFLTKADDNLSPANFYEDTEIGFRIQVRDMDKPGEQLKIIEPAGSAWSDPSTWNTLTVEGMPAPEIITIDGEIDEKWEEQTQFDIATVVDPESLAPYDVTDENDLSGYFKIYWEEDFLYVLGVVKDDALVNSPDSKNNSDHINLYIDPENRKEVAPEGEPGLISIGAGFDREGLMGRIAPGWGNPPGYDYGFKTTQDGYVVEFKIKSDSLRIEKFEPGKMIGLDVKINDVDDAENVNRDQLAWIDKDDLIYRDAWRYGTIELLEGGDVKGYTKPATPTNFSYTEEGNDITFTWDEVESATGYYFYINGELSESVTDNTITISDVMLNELYTYEVMAYSEGDVRSYFSDPLEIVLTISEISAPEISSDVSGNAVILSWEAVGNADGYKIFSGDKEIADITETSYEINDLADGTYNYTVKAYAGDMVSVESNVVSAIITGIQSVEREDIKIGPNPAHKSLYIRSTSIVYAVEVINVYGQKLLKVNTFAKNPVVDISQLKNGIYFIMVITDETKTMKAIIKQ